METVDAAVSALLVVLGFVLGLLSEPITDLFKKRRRRKRLATVLSSEVWMNRALAISRIPIQEESLKEIKGTTQHEKLVKAISISDADFPSTVYQASIDDLGLLNGDLVSNLTYFYSLLSQANHFKEENLKAVNDFNAFVSSTSGRPLTSFEVNLLHTLGRTTVHFIKAYLNSLHILVNLANDTLIELNEISPYKPPSRSMVELSETLREEF
jgi:hypothetical protein